MEENSAYLKKELSKKVKEAYRTPNSLSQKLKSPYHLIMKILNIQKKQY